VLRNVVQMLAMVTCVENTQKTDYRKRKCEEKQILIHNPKVCHTFCWSFNRDRDKKEMLKRELHTQSVIRVNF